MLRDFSIRVFVSQGSTKTKRECQCSLQFYLNGAQHAVTQLQPVQGEWGMVKDSSTGNIHERLGVGLCHLH